MTYFVCFGGCLFACMRPCKNHDSGSKHMRDDLQYDFEWIVCPHTHTHTQPLQDGYVPLMPLFVGLLLLLLFVFAFQPSPRAWLTPRWQLHVGSQIQGPLMSIKTRVTINHGLLLLFQISSCYHLFSIFIFLIIIICYIQLLPWSGWWCVR